MYRKLPIAVRKAVPHLKDIQLTLWHFLSNVVNMSTRSSEYNIEWFRRVEEKKGVAWATAPAGPPFAILHSHKSSQTSEHSSDSSEYRGGGGV